MVTELFFSLLPRSGSLLQNTFHTPFLSIIHKSFLPVPLLRLEIPQSRNHRGVPIQHQVQQCPTHSTAKQWQKNPRRCPAAPPQSINKQKRKRSHDCSQKHNFQHKLLFKGRKYLGCGNLGPSEPCQPGCKGFTLAQCENMTLGQLQGRAGLETDWLSLLRVFLPRCTIPPQCKDTPWFWEGRYCFFSPRNGHTSYLFLLNLCPCPFSLKNENILNQLVLT